MKKNPNHIAIILDGNGRWAKRILMPRNFGHYQGGLNLARIANYANTIGIKNLTFYAFSTENWARPVEEVKFLMTKPIEIVNKHYQSIVNANIRISFIGMRNRIPSELLLLMEKIELDTQESTGTNLKIGIDYGAKEEIINAVKSSQVLNEEEISKKLWQPIDVDLLIRTSGEMRLSNFMLWQAAYAELYFTKVYWPAFKPRHLRKAIRVYNERNRRFGGL